MHRNTLILIFILAIVAALVVGVNVGKKLTPQNSNNTTTFVHTPTASMVVQPTQESPSSLLFTDETCGVTFTYPNSLTLTQGASGSAVLVDQKHPEQSVLLACQVDIPRPPLSPENIEAATIAGSLNAKIYHDATAADGKPIDKLMFTNPNNGLDIFIAGLSPTFKQIISTIHLLP